MKTRFLPERKGERGNVLFLILIAVALFAALSYAVTQSTRSGSNDASDEQSLISSAQLTQYPAGVRTAMIRMVIGGLAAEDLFFDPPSAFGSLTAAQLERSVFHPNGGGAPFQLAPPELTSSGSQEQWVFSSDYEIVNIGQSVSTDSDGNDVIAFLPNVNRAICRKINDELGVSGGVDVDGDGIPIPATTFTNPDFDTHTMDTGNAGFGSTEVGIIGGAGGDAFEGQPFGCFDGDDSAGTGGDPTAPNFYYHVLIER